MNEEVKMKKCCRCDELKLATTEYFSKRSLSKDGLHYVCKVCLKNKVQPKIKSFACHCKRCDQDFISVGGRCTLCQVCGDEIMIAFKRNAGLLD